MSSYVGYKHDHDDGQPATADRTPLLLSSSFVLDTQNISGAGGEKRRQATSQQGTSL
jgi:hypothetical protein